MGKRLGIPTGIPKRTIAKMVSQAKKLGLHRKFKKSTNVPDIASCSVKRTMVATGGGQFNVNQMYELMNTQLQDYPRAVQIARAYQHYRIKSIKITYKPTADTFVVGGPASKPRLYYMLDKSGSIPTGITLEGLKGMGARPKNFDENNQTVTWSPSVLEAVAYAGGGVGAASTSKYTISPWLSTNANSVDPIWNASAVDHLGIYWYVDMLVGGGLQYAVEVEVQFQFKKPLAPLTTGLPAIKAVAAELNDSPDGVVGGGDGI